MCWLAWANKHGVCHSYKLFRQVTERWLTLLNSLGLGIRFILPSENHKGNWRSSSWAVAWKQVAISLLAISLLFPFFLLLLIVIINIIFIASKIGNGVILARAIVSGKHCNCHLQIWSGRWNAFQKIKINCFTLVRAVTIVFNSPIHNRTTVWAWCFAIWKKRNPDDSITLIK